MKVDLESKRMTLPKRMKTCLFHKQRKAIFWHGHIHYRNYPNAEINAGFCLECEDFDAWKINDEERSLATCFDCHGTVWKLR